MFLSMFKRLFIQLGKKNMELLRSYENSGACVLWLGAKTDGGLGKEEIQYLFQRPGVLTLHLPCVCRHSHKQFIVIYEATKVAVTPCISQAV